MDFSVQGMGMTCLNLFWQPHCELEEKAMRKLSVPLLIILTAVCILASPVAAVMITRVGIVNDDQQFVADNEIYEVENNAVGDDLVLNYTDQKVKVVGQLRETREHKIIKVESFEVIEE